MSPRASEAVAELSAENLESRTLGDFVIRKEIGRGGFGMVFQAEQRTLGREAVIKVLRAPLRKADDMADRFLREAKLASQLDHPYAAHVYAFGAEPDGLLWIAMELVRGTPLDRLIAGKGALALERFVPLLERICEVVHTAHEQGIVHRDLKPANVMVIARAGRLLPKLLDFGIAKAIGLAGGESADPTGVTTVSDIPTTTASTDIESDATMQAPTGASGAASDARTSSRSDAITRRGAMIGSPPYMAPEQWLDATAATARSDLYSLGILSYEALTGRRPFQGKTMTALAHEHAHAPPPSLGAKLPRALDEVIARALAKAPGDRYGSALELAHAVREASGLDAAAADEPMIEDPELETLAREAPEPIAQAALALVSARHAYQTRDALAQLGATIARWLGTVAVACRSRLGAAAVEDSPRARELLRATRQRAIDPLEWLELAGELARPYVDGPEAYPLPELVRAVTSPEVAQAAATVVGVGRVTGASVDPRAMREAIAAARPALGRLLDAVRFTADCPLVVVRDGTVELRMGSPGSPPARVSLHGALAQDGVALLDADGAPIVLLSPLVQAGAPAPGLPEVIFVFAGAETAAAGRARLVAATGAERFDDTVWGWLGDIVGDTQGARGEAAGDERSPYPGLLAFTAGDADMFFGREREIERVLNRVRAEPIVAVVGASGVGKSSFVAAGLVPALPASWRTIAFRPGATPVAALTVALGRALGSDYRGAGTLADVDPLELIARARAEAEVEGQTLVLVVDQLEELFTLCRDASERDRFGELLAQASRSAVDRLRVVVTLRDDFLARANEVAGLRDRLARAVELLSIPNRAALLRIVTAPAERAGYTFDDHALAARIVDDVADAPGALALLAFTVGQLWERRDRHFHRLVASAYDELGGVGGALARHAEHVLGQLPAGDQRLVREAFRHLVTAEGTRAVLTHAELSATLDADDRGDEVIERLVRARLLVTSDGGADGALRVEVVHEALLVAWPRLVEWRREDAEGARLRDQLRSAAQQWDDRGRPAGLLWRDEALVEYELWRARYPSPLAPREQAFTSASLAQASRARRRRAVALVCVVGALAIGLGTMTVLQQRTRAAQARTKAQLAASFVERGRRALLDGSSLDALVYLEKARSLDARGPGLEFMVARARPAIEARVAQLSGHVGKVHAAVYSPDGGRILTAGADHTARIWDAISGRQLAVLTGHDDEIDQAMFTPDGRQIVTCSYDGSARLWDAASGTSLATIRRAPDVRGGLACALSADGALLAAGQPDGHTIVWSIADRKTVRELAGHAGYLTSAAFSPDGGRLATGSSDHTVRLWDVATGRELAVLAHDGAVRAVAFRGDGAVLASAGWDHTIRLWDGSTGAAVRTLVGHTESVEGLDWARDGARLLSASRDGTAKLWDASNGALLASLPHHGYVAMARFSPDGARAVTASGDGTARVWELPSGTQLTSLEGHGSAVWVARFDPSGRRVLTASWDGTAMLWDADRRGLVASLRTHAERGWIVRFTGDSVAALGMDGAPQLWTPTTGKTIELRGADGADYTSLLASKDGRYVVVGTHDNEALVFETATGRRISRLAGISSPVIDLALSSDDGRLLASSLDGSTRIWEARRVWAGGDIEPLATLPSSGKPDPRGRCAISPDGQTMLTIANGSARLWRGSTDTPIATFAAPAEVQAVDVAKDGARFVIAGRAPEVLVVSRDGRDIVRAGGHGGTVMSAELSPDGHRLVTACEDGFARVFDADTGHLLGVLAGHASHVWHATWNPAGTLIATASVDETVKIWDAAQFTMLSSFAGHSDVVSMVAFDRTGTRLVSSGWDGRLRVWDVSSTSTDVPERELACLPRELEGTTLVPHAVDAATCRSLR